MPVEAADTRERLIDVALESCWLRGYQATSLSEICRRAGAE